MGNLVTFGETPLRLSPPGSERVELTDSLELYADGIESNVAAAASALGTDSLWVSKVPETAIGRNVVRTVRSTGVETEISWAEDDLRQGLTFRESSASPRETQSWHDRGRTALSTAEPGEFPMARLQEASVVYTALSSAVLSETAAATIEAILRASGGSGAVTAVELDFTPGLDSPSAFKQAFEQLSGEVDVLIAPEDAVSTVLDETGAPRELTNTLSAVYDLQIVVIRRADGSAVALHDTPGTNVIHERSAIDSEMLDPAGEAGAFTGGFLHELIQGADAARALTVGIASATLAGTIPGPFLTTDGEEIEPLTERVIEQSQ